MHDVRVTLVRHPHPDYEALFVGTAYSTTSSHSARFSATAYKHRHLPPDEVNGPLVRQLAYQAKKVAEAIAHTRRTGYVMRVVEREGHRLAGRIYWQHEATGRIRWGRPA